jgi:hypothetical protein
MKKSLVLLGALTLAGCGMTDGERQNIADVTCTILKNTSDQDSLVRIREVNVAREKLGESGYLGEDAGIIEAIEYGVCDELVLNYPGYDSLLLAMKDSKQKLAAIAVEKEKQYHAEQLEEFKIGRGVHTLQCKDPSDYFGYGRVNFTERRFSINTSDYVRNINDEYLMSEFEVDQNAVSWVWDSGSYKLKLSYSFGPNINVTRVMVMHSDNSLKDLYPLSCTIVPELNHY